MVFEVRPLQLELGRVKSTPVTWSTTPATDLAWMQDEYKQATAALENILHDQHLSKDERALKKILRQFLALRWQLIKNSDTNYFSFFNSPLNQLCVSIAEQIAEPNEPIIKVLVPKLDVSVVYYDETFRSITLQERTEIEQRKLLDLSVFNLNEDKTKLIPILPCLEQARRMAPPGFIPVFLNQYSGIDQSGQKLLDGKKKHSREHDNLLSNLSQPQLSAAEIIQLQNTAPDYYNALIQLETNPTNTAYIGDASWTAISELTGHTLWYELQILCRGLTDGGVEDTSAPAAMQNQDIGRQAKWAIKRFHSIWMRLDSDTRKRVGAFTDNSDITITQKELQSYIPTGSGTGRLIAHVASSENNGQGYYIYQDTKGAVATTDGDRIITGLLDSQGRVIPHDRKLTLQLCLAKLFAGFADPSLLPNDDDWKKDAQNMTAGGHTCIIVVRTFIQRILEAKGKSAFIGIKVISPPVTLETQRVRNEELQFNKLSQQLEATLPLQRYIYRPSAKDAPNPQRYQVLTPKALNYVAELFQIFDNAPNEPEKLMCCETIGWGKISSILVRITDRREFFHRIKNFPTLLASMYQDPAGFQFILDCQKRDCMLNEKVPCHVDGLVIYRDRWRDTYTFPDYTNQDAVLAHIETVFTAISTRFQRAIRFHFFTNGQEIANAVIENCQRGDCTPQQMLELLTNQLVTLSTQPTAGSTYMMRTNPREIGETSMRVIHCLLLLGHHITSIAPVLKQRPRSIIFS